MIKLVVCSLVLLIIIKSSHQDPEDEEIQKRFNNAHLLRGRRRYLDNFWSSFSLVFEIIIFDFKMTVKRGLEFSVSK